MDNRKEGERQERGIRENKGERGEWEVPNN